MKIILSWHNIFYRRNEVEVFRWVAKVGRPEFEFLFVFFFNTAEKLSWNVILIVCTFYNTRDNIFYRRSEVEICRIYQKSDK